MNLWEIKEKYGVDQLCRPTEDGWTWHKLSFWCSNIELHNLHVLWLDYEIKEPEPTKLDESCLGMIATVKDLNSNKQRKILVTEDCCNGSFVVGGKMFNKDGTCIEEAFDKFIITKLEKPNCAE